MPKPKEKSVKEPPYYLLLGPETGRKDEHIRSIRDALEKKLGEAPEEHRIYPYKMDMTELVGLLNNRSLFSPHRLVLVLEAQEITKKADIETLCSYLRNPGESSTLILLSSEYHLDKRIEKVAPKNRIKIFWELFEHEKQSWIQNYFRNSGLAISKDASDLILELVENDTADLRRECEKLTLFYPAGTPITESEVENILFHSKNENVFSLFAHIAEADLPSALETLHAITLGGPFEPAGLLGGLAWQFRKLLGFRRLKDSRYSDEDAARTMKIRGKRNLRTYQAGAKNYTRKDLEHISARTHEYDVLFRTMRTGIDRKLMELYLYEIIIGRGARPLFAEESVPV